MKYGTIVRRRRPILASSCAIFVLLRSGAVAGPGEERLSPPAEALRPVAMASWSGEERLSQPVSETPVENGPACCEEREAEAGAAPVRLAETQTENADSGGNTVILVQPVLNERTLDECIFVVERNGEFLLPEAFLEQHGLDCPHEDEVIEGRIYRHLRHFPEMRAALAEKTGELHLSCGAGCYASSRLDGRRTEVFELSPVAAGGFLNYDLFAQAGGSDAAYGGFFEAGVFSNAGSGLVTAACSKSDAGGTCVRHETNWTIDDPLSLRRLRLGDAITQGSRWSAPVRFGGVRWGSEFLLRPDFVTFPTPSFSGESALPGVLEVFIEGVRRLEIETPPGPFTITDLPVVTGAGAAQVVVTDVLGRQSVINANYYASPLLLKPGLDEYSVEAGFLRRDFGVRSNSYDDAFAAGGYARGLADWLTAGVRSELSADHRTAGLSLAAAAAGFGVIEANAAFSDRDGRAGGLFDLRHEWRSAGLSLGAAASYATEGFQRFGQDRPAARLTATSFLGYNDRTLGSASVNWIYRDERERDDFSAVSLRYTRSFRRISVFLSALRTLDPERGLAATLMLSFPFGGAAAASASADYDEDSGIGGDLRLRRSPPVAGGFGYHARIARDGVSRFAAGAEYRTAHGDFAAEFSKAGGAEAGRLSARGGAALLAGEFILAPTVTESMAVVSVGEEEGVRIFHDRQEVGRTNRQGKAVVPRLRPYERNRISFEARDVNLSSTFQSDEIAVTPGFRTGHRVDFGVHRADNLVARLILGDARPARIGASLVVIGTGEGLSIGADGMFFIPDAQPGMRVRYEDREEVCEAEIPAPVGDKIAPIRNAGDIVCVRMETQEGQ